MNNKMFFNKIAAFCGTVALVLGSYSCSNNDNPADPGPNIPDTCEKVELTKFVKATYEYFDGYGIYTLTVSNETFPAGKPSAEGEQSLNLGFCAVASDDPLNAVLPDGIYKKGDVPTTGSWLPKNSSISIYMRDNAQDIKVLPLTDGTITVSHEGNNYTIVMDITSGDTELSYRYTGPIPFTSVEENPGEWFSKPLNLTFEKADLRYYANWYYPHTDDTMLELYAGDATINSNNDYQLNSGYGLYLPTNIFKISADDEISLPEGEYRVSGWETDYMTAIPMTMDIGRMVFVELLYQDIPVGSYLRYINPETGMETLGVIVSGKMNVTASGNGTRIEVDLTTREGISVKGVFDGELNILDRCNNANEPKRPFTGLKNDKNVKFPEKAYAVAYYRGEILYPNLGSWTLYIGPEGMLGESHGNPVGDYIQMEFLTELQNDSPLTLPEGTYTVSFNLETQSVLPGVYEYDQTPAYSWYADLTSGAMNDTFAPISAGTMTITRQGDSYNISFDFKDDGEMPHKIIGGWNGKVSVVSLVENTTAKHVLLHRTESNVLVR